MSDQAWIGLIATAYELADVERFYAEHADIATDFDMYWQKVLAGSESVHTRYFKGMDYTRSTPTREEAYESWKASNWKQAVLHAELKSRHGHEPRLMLFYLQGAYIHGRRGVDYEGYVPNFVTCECCWQNTYVQDEDEFVFFDQCDECRALGHEAGPDMSNRWHTYLGIWWVEKLEDNGEGYFPTSFVVWYDKDNEGESVARVEADKQRALYPPEDLINLVDPMGNKTVITAQP